MPKQLDPVAVEELTHRLLRSIRAHYASRPTARETVHEVINALSTTAAVVIHGTGDADSIAETRGFLIQVVDLELADLKQRDIGQ